MLAVSPLSTCGIERDGGVMLDGSFASGHATGSDNEHDQFIGDDEFLGRPMLEDFNFDDLSFLDFDGKDALPNLEVDLGQFCLDGGEEFRTAELASRDNDECKRLSGGENKDSPSPEPEDEKEGKKVSSHAKVKGSNGKRKAKVDWTPELHRRFVQAVEQLGIDKAVPSRILEIMGIDGLTRHNIASHLQKYRCHWRHLLAREAEAAAGWSHRRHMYPTAAGGPKTPSPWPVALAPSTMGMGFLSPHPPPPPQPQHPAFRTLHVWGHPTVDTWPKYFLSAATSPPPPWLPPPPPTFPWLLHYPRGPNVMTQGTPCFPRPVPPAMRFPPPIVLCIPPQPLYRPNCAAVHPNNKKPDSQLLDTLALEERIDAAIGDVLVKPWLPLPLGLKPPSVESVLVELQKQVISKVPPRTG